MAQKCRCRMSLSCGRKSYSMSSRCIVSRCRRSTAIEIICAISAVSLPPTSSACSVSRRACRFALSCLIPLRNLGIQIPAVVVEAPFASGNQRFNFRLRLLRHPLEAHHHVGHLHARVVDVVLHIHLVACRAQQPHQRVAQNRVAQMPDVRRLVRIDRGVLHQHLAPCARGRSGIASAAYPMRAMPAASPPPPAPPPRPVQPRVDVSRPGHLEVGKSLRQRSSPPQSRRRSCAEPCASVRASSKETGSANSPNSIFGGCSTTMLASSIVVFLFQEGAHMRNQAVLQ